MAMMNMSEAAKSLSLSTKTLQRWRKRPGAPFREADGRVEVDVDELRRWADGQGLSGGAGRPFGALSDPGAGLGGPDTPADPAAGPSPTDTPAPGDAPVGGDAAAETPAEIERRVRAEVEGELLGVNATLRQDLARVELRRRELDAEAKALALQERRGRLLDAAEVERGRVQRILVVKKGLESLGARLASVLPGVGPEEVRQTIDAEVDSLLRQFVEEFRPL